jgi:transcriptional regulator with XRE-family HTH domain
MAMGDNFAERLLSDREGQKLYFREDLIFEVTETICRVMEEKGISRTELAEIAGVSKSNITQLLSGDQNMRLTTVADLLFALDAKLEVTAVPAAIEIDNILQSVGPSVQDDWTLAGRIIAEALEYEQINESETGQLTQAA